MQAKCSLIALLLSATNDENIVDLNNLSDIPWIFRLVINKSDRIVVKGVCVT